MANCIEILGKSGSGKTHSIRNMNPETTVIITPLNKRMLWDKKNLYSKENKNLFHMTNYLEVIKIITAISENAKNINAIIIDDMIYIMTKEFFKRAKESGYGKYTELAQHFEQVIEACENARKDLNVFFMLHAEEVYDDGNLVGYKARTIGKLVDSSYNPCEVVSILLFADKKYDESGKVKYGFYTHPTMVGKTEIPAKSGDLFDEDWVENDLNVIINKLNEYQGEE